MKYRILGIYLDFEPVVGMFHAFFGLMLIGLTFMIPEMGWWNVPYFIIIVFYLAMMQGKREEEDDG